jgi:hypothetical protein
MFAAGAASAAAAEAEAVVEATEVAVTLREKTEAELPVELDAYGVPIAPATFGAAAGAAGGLDPNPFEAAASQVRSLACAPSAGYI